MLWIQAKLDCMEGYGLHGLEWSNVLVVKLAAWSFWHNISDSQEDRAADLKCWDLA